MSKPLVFDNNWMRLYFKGRDQLRHVEFLSTRGEIDTIDYNYVSVATMNEGWSAFAKENPSKVIDSRCLAPESTAQFFIEGKGYTPEGDYKKGRYCAVRMVCNDIEKISRHLMMHEDQGLFATDNYGFHYVADLERHQLNL